LKNFAVASDLARYVGVGSNHDALVRIYPGQGIHTLNWATLHGNSPYAGAINPPMMIASKKAFPVTKLYAVGQESWTQEIAWALHGYLTFYGKGMVVPQMLSVYSPPAEDSAALLILQSFNSKFKGYSVPWRYFEWGRPTLLAESVATTEMRYSYNVTRFLMDIGNFRIFSDPKIGYDSKLVNIFLWLHYMATPLVLAIALALSPLVVFSSYAFLTPAFVFMVLAMVFMEAINGSTFVRHFRETGSLFKGIGYSLKEIFTGFFFWVSQAPLFFNGVRSAMNERFSFISTKKLSLFQTYNEKERYPVASITVKWGVRGIIGTAIYLTLFFAFQALTFTGWGPLFTGVFVVLPYFFASISWVGGFTAFRQFTGKQSKNMDANPYDKNRVNVQQLKNIKNTYKLIKEMFVKYDLSSSYRMGEVDVNKFVNEYKKYERNGEHNVLIDIFKNNNIKSDDIYKMKPEQFAKNLNRVLNEIIDIPNLSQLIDGADSTAKSFDINEFKKNYKKGQDDELDKMLLYHEIDIEHPDSWKSDGVITYTVGEYTRIKNKTRLAEVFPDSLGLDNLNINSTMTPEILAKAGNELIGIKNFIKLLDTDKGLSQAEVFDFNADTIDIKAFKEEYKTGKNKQLDEILVSICGEDIDSWTAENVASAFNKYVGNTINSAAKKSELLKSRFSPYSEDEIDLNWFKKEHKNQHKVVNDILVKYKIDLNDDNSVTSERLRDAFNELINISNLVQLLAENKGISDVQSGIADMETIVANKQKMAEIYPHSLEKTLRSYPKTLEKMILAEKEIIINNKQKLAEIYPLVFSQGLLSGMRNRNVLGFAGVIFGVIFVLAAVITVFPVFLILSHTLLLSTSLFVKQAAPFILLVLSLLWELLLIKLLISPLANKIMIHFENKGYPQIYYLRKRLFGEKELANVDRLTRANAVGDLQKIVDNKNIGEEARKNAMNAIAVDSLLVKFGNSVDEAVDSLYSLDNDKKNKYVNGKSVIGSVDAAPYRVGDINVAEINEFLVASLGASPYRINDIGIEQFKKEYKSQYKLINKVLTANDINLNDLNSVAPEYLVRAFNELINMPRLIELLDSDMDLSIEQNSKANIETIIKNKQKLSTICPFLKFDNKKIVLDILETHGISATGNESVTPEKIVIVLNELIAIQNLSALIENKEGITNVLPWVADAKTIADNKKELIKLYPSLFINSSEYSPDEINAVQFKKEYKKGNGQLDEVFAANIPDLDKPKADQIQKAFNVLINIPNLSDVIEKKAAPVEGEADAATIIKNKQAILKAYPNTLNLQLRISDLYDAYSKNKQKKKKALEMLVAGRLEAGLHSITGGDKPSFKDVSNEDLVKYAGALVEKNIMPGVDKLDVLEELRGKYPKNLIGFFVNLPDEKVVKVATDAMSNGADVLMGQFSEDDLKTFKHPGTAVIQEITVSNKTYEQVVSEIEKIKTSVDGIMLKPYSKIGAADYLEKICKAYPGLVFVIAGGIDTRNKEACSKILGTLPGNACAAVGSVPDTEETAGAFNSNIEYYVSCIPKAKEVKKIEPPAPAKEATTAVVQQTTQPEVKETITKGPEVKPSVEQQNPKKKLSFKYGARDNQYQIYIFKEEGTEQLYQGVDLFIKDTAEIGVRKELADKILPIFDKMSQEVNHTTWAEAKSDNVKAKIFAAIVERYKKGLENKPLSGVVVQEENIQPDTRARIENPPPAGTGAGKDKGGNIALGNVTEEEINSAIDDSLGKGAFIPIPPAGPGTGSGKGKGKGKGDEALKDAIDKEINELRTTNKDIAALSDKELATLKSKIFWFAKAIIAARNAGAPEDAAIASRELRVLLGKDDVFSRRQVLGRGQNNSIYVHLNMLAEVKDFNKVETTDNFKALVEVIRHENRDLLRAESGNTAHKKDIEQKFFDEFIRPLFNMHPANPFGIADKVPGVIVSDAQELLRKEAPDLKNKTIMNIYPGLMNDLDKSRLAMFDGMDVNQLAIEFSGEVLGENISDFFFPLVVQGQDVKVYAYREEVLPGKFVKVVRLSYAGFQELSDEAKALVVKDSIRSLVKTMNGNQEFTKEIGGAIGLNFSETFAPDLMVLNGINARFAQPKLMIDERAMGAQTSEEKLVYENTRVIYNLGNISGYTPSNIQGVVMADCITMDNDTDAQDILKFYKTWVQNRTVKRLYDVQLSEADQQKNVLRVYESTMLRKVGRPLRVSPFATTVSLGQVRQVPYLFDEGIGGWTQAANCANELNGSLGMIIIRSDALSRGNPLALNPQNIVLNEIKGVGTKMRAEIEKFSATEKDYGRNYIDEDVLKSKAELVDRVYDSMKNNNELKIQLAQFYKNNAEWLDNYCKQTALESMEIKLSAAQSEQAKAMSLDDFNKQYRTDGWKYVFTQKVLHEQFAASVKALNSKNMRPALEIEVKDTADGLEAANKAVRHFLEETLNKPAVDGIRLKLPAFASFGEREFKWLVEVRNTINKTRPNAAVLVAAPDGYFAVDAVKNACADEKIGFMFVDRYDVTKPRTMKAEKGVCLEAYIPENAVLNQNEDTLKLIIETLVKNGENADMISAPLIMLLSVGEITGSPKQRMPLASDKIGALTAKEISNMFRAATLSRQTPAQLYQDGLNFANVPKISQADWKKLYSLARDFKAKVKTAATDRSELNKMFGQLYETLNTIPLMTKQNWSIGWDEIDSFERLAMDPQVTAGSIYEQFVSKYTGIVDQIPRDEFVAASQNVANPLPVSSKDFLMFMAMLSSAYSVLDEGIEALPAMILFRKAEQIRKELAQAILPESSKDVIGFAYAFADDSLTAENSGTVAWSDIESKALDVTNSLLAVTRDSEMSGRINDETGRYFDTQIAYYNALKKMAEVERRVRNYDKKSELDTAMKNVADRIGKYMKEEFIEAAAERTTDLRQLILLISYDYSPNIKRSLMDKIYNALVNSNDPVLMVDVSNVMVKQDENLEEIQKYIRSVSADSIAATNSPRTIAKSFETVVDKFTDRTVVNKKINKAVTNELSIAAFGRAG
jgi:hypothetical protein